jgi:uncharacterized protein YecE (DUF72 family)
VEVRRLAWSHLLPGTLLRSRTFRKGEFERECLKEYSEVFRTVSGDFAFYQFPSAELWANLFKQVEQPFRFAFKAPEEITAPAFPNGRRYGLRAGHSNPSFLNTTLLIREFLEPLRQFRESVGVILFEFPAATARFVKPQAFAERLGSFLRALPKDFRYGIEIRSPEFFRREYLRMLRDQGVAHVFNAWTDMLPLGQQMAEKDAFTTDLTVCRALTVPGRSYEDSVRLFKPYSSVREPNGEVRKALRELLVRSKLRRETAFIFVNNRLEGFSPGTIARVVEGEELD